MPHIHGAPRDQVLLFPPSLDEYITDDNPVRFIDAFVDQLDLHQLGFSRAVASSLGRPAYHPADLLKLYIYGYLNRLRSSRLLERETRRNVELIWLLKKLAAAGVGVGAGAAGAGAAGAGAGADVGVQ